MEKLRLKLNSRMAKEESSQKTVAARRVIDHRTKGIISLNEASLGDTGLAKNIDRRPASTNGGRSFGEKRGPSGGVEKAVF